MQCIAPVKAICISLSLALTLTLSLSLSLKSWVVNKQIVEYFELNAQQNRNKVPAEITVYTSPSPLDCKRVAACSSLSQAVSAAVFCLTADGALEQIIYLLL